MTTASAARTLDAGEKFFWMLDQVSCMNFVVFAELECQLPPATLQAALGELQRRHPLLNCGIRVGDAGHVAFYRTEPTPIRLSVQPVAADSWQEPLQAQLAQPFAAEEHPLARALYLPRSDAPGSIVGLVYHHAIADGRSGTALLREWLQQALTELGLALPTDTARDEEPRWLADLRLGLLHRAAGPAGLQSALLGGMAVAGRVLAAFSGGDP